jgi:hypothetical protein
MMSTTLAIDTINGKRVAIPVPVGEIIKVISGPTNDDRLIDVLWNGHSVMMFAIDIKERGEEITELGA